MSQLTSDPDVCHWLDIGISCIDTPHWVPYMSSSELGLHVPKLTLDFVSGSSVAEPDQDKRLPVSVGRQP